MHKDARFIGKDGSCDLQRMKVYRIEIIENKPSARFRFRVFVNGIGIPYDTMNAIKKNWTFLYEQHH